MEINFEKSDGLVPAIVQDTDTLRVLMLGYMNAEALAHTRRTGRVTFYSRSKHRLWTKGETSGNFLEMTDIKVDCDGDTLLVYARPTGGVCHTGADTCFEEENRADFWRVLQGIIQGYQQQPREGSYTSSLFAKGINKIAQKVGEEAIEVVIEAKDNNLDLFKNECADLLYHFLVLLAAKGTSFDEIVSVLQARHQPS